MRTYDTSVSEYPKKLVIGFQDGYCNLKCPMCFVHGSDDIKSIKALRGNMSYENACKIFDEIANTKPRVSPCIWTEPFIFKDMRRYILAMKERGIPVTINTNGLLLTDELIDFLVQNKVDSIFFSIDAMTKETLQKIRGVEDLVKIKEVVFKILKSRGDLDTPRIGVSFVVQEGNRHEREEFVSYWLDYVDTIRIDEEIKPDRSVPDAVIPEKRVPCAALYDMMVINHKGDVSICCLDSFGSVKLGNVLKDGVKKVWHSEKFQEIRHFHETGQYDKVPFCKNCDAWAKYIVEEEIVDGILISSSSLVTHYNRLDKMNTWKAGKIHAFSSKA